MSTTGPVHVAIGHSIAETLREALQLLGRDEPVVTLPVNLAVGPIDPPDPIARRSWADAALRAAVIPPDERDADPAVDVDLAWAQATSPARLPVLWVCRRSPMEHAGFLAFAARMQGRPFDIVDVTDLDVPGRNGIGSPASLGMLRAEDIVAADLYSRRRPLSAEKRLAAAAAWADLRRENAPFRIVEAGRLVSAPLTLYDPLLLGHAAHDWEIAAALLGRVVGALVAAPAGRATGGGVLFGRLLVLAESGALEITGPGPGMRDYRVRKPHDGRLNPPGPVPAASVWSPPAAPSPPPGASATPVSAGSSPAAPAGPPPPARTR